MNIHLQTQAQHPINNRPSQEPFPATPGWLAQNQLCDVTLMGDLHQCPGNVATAGTDDFSAEVFSQQCVLLQATLRFCPVLACSFPIFE